jgi:hypothetical protein
MMLGMEPRALHILDKYSVHELHPQPLPPFFSPEIGSFYGALTGLELTMNPRLALNS